MPTSLITGIGGFIASHVADHLLSMGHKVVGLDDLSGGFVENVPSGCIFVEGSFLNTDVVDYMFKTWNFDYVYHCGAYAAEGLSHFIKRFNYQNNLIGSVNLINASVNYGVKRFVFTSSIAVYGASAPPFVESYGLNPEDPYGMAKLCVEKELELSHKMFGLEYTIFRPHNVYGERQNIGDRYRNVVGIFMNQCLKGEPMTIFGSGENVRQFTYIGDIAKLIAESAQNPDVKNETFNIGNGLTSNINNLSEAVAKAMNVPHRTVHLPSRCEVEEATASHEKLEQFFGMQPFTLLRESLPDMAAWVKQHGSRQSKEFEHIEIEKNLPPSWRKSDSTLRISR